MMAEEEPALVVWGEFSERFDLSLYMYTFTEFCFLLFSVVVSVCLCSTLAA